MSEERFKTIQAEIPLALEAKESDFAEAKRQLHEKAASLIPLKEGIYIHDVTTDVSKDMYTLTWRARVSITYGTPDKVIYEQQTR